MRRAPLTLALLLLVGASDASAQVARRPFLFKDARGELAQARARGESDVLLVIASMRGRNARVVDEIRGMGGTVQFRDDDVDYVRARVPVDRVQELAASSDVHSVDVSVTGLSRSFGMADGEQAVAPELPGITPADTITEPWPPVLGDYPLRNRYSPLEDVRARGFLEANPTYDGRGVLIAMIDMSPDMLLPELQTATSLDGTAVPKIAVYEAVLDVDEEDDGRWLRMDDMVEARGGAFEYRDSTYRAPRDGTFRVTLFDEVHADTAAVFGSQGLDGDVNRDGNPEGASRLFGVLWDEAAGDVWVDTDQDFDFTDERTLGEFNERREFGVFGTDDPDTPVRESIGFGVQIDEDRKLIALNLGIASHASLVVGAALASRGEEGRFDGVAPGAQLASVAEGGSAYGQTEAAIVAARRGADVIYFEQSSNITRNYLLRDGRLVPSVIYDRVVESMGPSILSPTHNYPVLGAIDDIVMGRGTIGIGGHESKENFFLNHGVRVEHDDNLLITGGYGPMGDGSLKPDVISPSNYVSTAQGFVEGRAMPGLFQLPPGYTIAGGTSTATPTAAGSVALLISGARQAGIPHDALRLKYAVTRSARWVPHIAAYKQGNGVVNVEDAWQILRELAAGAPMIEIESRAPVRWAYSHLLPTPHEGVGLYERSGWDVGDRDERVVTLTRKNGPGAPMTFSVSWAGNEHGAFSAPLSVTLPLNEPVSLPITVAPRAYGVHTAHLTLDHPDVPGYAHRMLATVVAAEPLSARNDYSVEKSVEVPRPGMQSYFYDVPEGVTALKLDLAWEDRAVAMAVVRPDTRAQRGALVGSGQSRVTQVVHDPMPGMWEVRLSDVADTRTFDWEQAKKEEPVPPTPATLTVSALSADVSVVSGGAPVADNGSPSSAAAPGSHQVWITNRMAAFTGGAVSTPVGSARAERRTIAQGEQQMLEVEVLPGSEALIVRTRVSGADLDVYAFDCSEEECRAARVDGDPVGDESLVIEDPAAGLWKIVVDGADVPAGEVEYDYLDVLLNPVYGMVGSADMPQERARDARWTAAAHSWIAPAAHEDGRAPYLVVRVRGEQDDESFWVSLGEVATGRGAAAFPR